MTQVEGNTDLTDTPCTSNAVPNTRLYNFHIAAQSDQTSTAQIAPLCGDCKSKSLCSLAVLDCICACRRHKFRRALLQSAPPRVAGLLLFTAAPCHPQHLFAVTRHRHPLAAAAAAAARAGTTALCCWRRRTAHSHVHSRQHATSAGTRPRLTLWLTGMRISTGCRSAARSNRGPPSTGTCHEGVGHVGSTCSQIQQLHARILPLANCRGIMHATLQGQVVH